MTPSVEVSILVYNQWASTLRLFKSLFKNTKYDNLKITVFNNNSTDETRSGLEKYADKISIIHSNKNIGFGPGHNKVSAQSNADYLLVLNNDVEVPLNWLSNLVEIAEADKNIGILSPINRTRGQLILGARLRKDGKGERVYKGEATKLDWLQGSCLLMRKEMIEEIGLFDEDFEIGYYEDVDLCIRAKKAGYGMVCTDNVIIEHHDGVTSKPHGLKKYQEINRQKFILKHQKYLDSI